MSNLKLWHHRTESGEIATSLKQSGSILLVFMLATVDLQCKRKSFSAAQVVHVLVHKASCTKGNQSTGNSAKWRVIHA